MQATVTKSLNEALVKAFQNANHASESRWQKCVDAQEAYFEEF